MRPNYKKYIFLGSCLAAALAGWAQQTGQPAGFEIISRTSLAGEKGGRLGLSASRQEASFSLQSQQGNAVYRVQTNGSGAVIPALSNIEIAAHADRVLVYGDSLERHVAYDLFLSLYTGHGQPVKSLGHVAVLPWVVQLTQQGSVVVAGNTGKDTSRLTNFLRLYDKQGNRLWERPLPAHVPNDVFSSADGRYIAVVLYDPIKSAVSIRYYDGKGTLLYTHADAPSISGIEFLSSGKVVINSGNVWDLYDLTAGYKYLQSGELPGVAVGKYPVTAHPSKDIFFIVATDGAKKGGYTLQAYDGKGGLLARGAFAGEPYWQSYRLAEVGTDGIVRFITDKEIITLRMK